MEHRTWMNSYAEHRFCCLVDVLTMVASAVPKKGTGDAFSYIGVLVVFIYA